MEKPPESEEGFGRSKDQTGFEIDQSRSPDPHIENHHSFPAQRLGGGVPVLHGRRPPRC
ncbi:hypothetical protein Bca101_021878 [Brassica carinata]